MFNHKIQLLSTTNRILFITVIVVLQVTILLTTIETNYLFQGNTAQARHADTNEAQYVAQLIEDNCVYAANQLLLVQQTLADLDFTAKESEVAADNVMVMLMELNPDVHCAWFILQDFYNDEGNRYARDYLRVGDKLYIDYGNDEDILDDPELAPWYMVPLTTGEVYFDNLVMYDYGEELGDMHTATISVPIGVDGKMIGVCGVDIVYNGMFDFIINRQANHGRLLLLLSPNMDILHAYNDEQINRNFSEFQFSDSDMDSIFDTMKRGEAYTAELVSPFFNEKSLITLTPMAFEIGTTRRQPLYLYSDTPLSILYADMYKINQIMIIARVVGFVFILISIFVCTHNLIRPIRKLTRDARLISNGIFDVEFDAVPPDEIMNDKNEIAVLQRALMDMTDRLLENLNFVEQRVEERTHELMLMTEEAKEARKKAEEASNAEIKFLANMSHEIRTPMNAIIGMSEVLTSGGLSEAQLSQVKDIKTSAMALLEIVNSILDISRLQSGKLELSPVHFDFGAMVDNINSMVTSLAVNKSIKFEYKSSGEMPSCIYADDVRLREILLNLLGNSVKFTDQGFVYLDICVKESEIEFIISDTGIGIREEDIPLLYDAFSQADMKRNRYKKGTGLGLSITKSLVEMMGGAITVNSIYGQGTTFRVTIPKVLGDERKIVRDQWAESLLYAPGAKVLVVDDNQINLNVMEGLLGLFKITPDTAISGHETIERMGTNQYDIVFMDHMMPDMDGVEATSRLRSMGIKTPIVALTANAIEGAKEMFLASGMDDFLTKPIEKTQLKGLLERWIPADKLMDVPSAGVMDITKADKDKIFWDHIEKISAISVEKGLARVSGKRKFYEKSLRLLTKEIDRCKNSLNGFLTAGDLPNFAIVVHSIKSSLAYIGAEDLSVQAAELEFASKNGDTARCADKLPGFLEVIGKLCSELNVAFDRWEKA